MSVVPMFRKSIATSRASRGCQQITLSVLERLKDARLGNYGECRGAVEDMQQTLVLSATALRCGCGCGGGEILCLVNAE